MNRLSRKPPQRHRHLSGIVRPDHQRPPRSDRARLADVRPADRLDSAERRQAAALLAWKSARKCCAKWSHVYPNVEVDSFDGLLVDHAAAHAATVLLRGIRAISDYEYELQMALMNRRLRPEIETVFMMANEAYSFISSRLVKEVFGLGGNISGLVPPSVEARLQRRLSKTKRKGA